MTHITDKRVIGNHADMGTSSHNEIGAARSTWDSEGGASPRDAVDRESASASGDAEGSSQTPTHLGGPLNRLTSAK
jgi:hypothetical protein